MKILDDVTARMFPTLARYARKVERKGRLLGYGFAFLLGVAATVAFAGYHLHVATVNLQAWGPRVAVIEAQYERDHKGALTVTKVQANDSAWKREKEKRP